MLKQIGIVFILLCGLLSTRVGILAAEAETYRGRGEALVVNNDLPKAKREALGEAFKSALQKAVGVYIKAKTKVENFEVTYSKILSDSEGYIRSFKILKEKTDDGIYSVEIEAQVSGEKLDTAFSQRISKFVEKNLFSTLSLQASAMASENRFYHLSDTITIMVNDPTIDTESIQLRLPVSGWIKPRVTKAGLANIITLTETMDPKNLATPQYMADVIRLIENKTATVAVRFRNPATGKEETRELAPERMTVTATVNGPAMSLMNRDVREVSDRERADTASAMRKALVALEYEKKLIGASGILMVTVGTFKQAAGTYAAITMSFTIPETAAGFARIDARSIQVGLPVSGWQTPEITERDTSIEVLLKWSGNDPRSIRQLADIAQYLRQDSMELPVRYRQKGASVHEQRLALVTYVTIIISEEGTKIFDVQGKSFGKIDAAQKAAIRAHLERLLR